MASDQNSYEFYVGEGAVLEGASIEISGTARIDGRLVGKIRAKHLIVGPSGSLNGDISGETASIEGVIEDSLELTGKLTVCATGKIRGSIRYGSIQCDEGARLVGEIVTDWDESLDQTMSSSERIRALAATISTDEDEKADVGGFTAE